MTRLQRVENHNRLSGWEGLIQKLAKELEEKKQIDP